MPFDDEDPHAVGPATGSSGAGRGDPNAEAADDDDADDKTQDFRLFNSSSSSNSSTRRQQASGRAIRRGEKDFEAHGTRAQEGQLEASRAAMREVLGHTRTHRPRDHLRGWYFPDRWAAVADDNKTGDDRGLFACERVVVLESDRGTLAHTTGRVVTGAERGSPGWLKTWLLPEEALYLLERGSLDLWWPARGIECVFPPSSSSSSSSSERRGGGGDGEEKKQEKEEGGEEGEGEGEEGQVEKNAKIPEDYELGVPLSLQAAYALLIGRDGDRGKVALEKYQVYANLRRSGYKVLRATPLPPPPLPAPTPARTLWEWLFALLAWDNNNSPQHQEPALSTPLVRPGLYRSYAQVYARLALIPRHKPSAVTDLTPPPTFSSSYSSTPATTATTTPQPAPPPEAEEENNPFRVYYHVWNNSNNSGGAASFTKARPPPPDFRVAVVDARASGVPTLEQVRGLLERGAPFEEVDPAFLPTTTITTQQNAGVGIGIGAVYRRLKHGWRNAVVAVVDGGLVSYLRFGEMAFGEERLYERFGVGVVGSGGGKRGGGRGGGRGGKGGRGGGGGMGGRGRGR
ncbi:tRNA-splicing endonuclease subunit sen54 N-term-domain-containing protein [Biscogniauxia mediterranea]|nr:tRNA-splicing endonuclease subunit sen54 N-term-domain-containing protein [Biscogniauxia mediterranea]